MKLKVIGDDIYMGDCKVATLHKEITSVTWEFTELLDQNFNIVDRAAALSVEIEDLLKSVVDDIDLIKYRLTKAAK